MTQALDSGPRDVPFVEQARAALHSGGVVKLSVGAADLSLDTETAERVLTLVQARLAGRRVVVEPLPDELTTGQAADLLGVTRPTVVAMVDRGELPARRIGTHRRVETEHVLRLREELSARRRSSLNALTELSVQTGQYD